MSDVGVSLILLDIEGTVSPIAFVHETLFPYARTRLAEFFRDNWQCPGLGETRDLIARDASAASFAQWSEIQSPDPSLTQQRLVAHLAALMDRDAKATGLKQLQGMIWKSGYENGELRSVLFDDVPTALRRWADAGLDTRIYSSGSAAAQKLFFQYTLYGDLTPLLRGHYDTTIGAKGEKASYERIASDSRHPASQILFVSDVVRELDAARSAGLQTALALRPGNSPVADYAGHSTIQTLDEINLVIARK